MGGILIYDRARLFIRNEVAALLCSKCKHQKLKSICSVVTGSVTTELILLHSHPGLFTAIPRCRVPRSMLK